MAFIRNHSSLGSVGPWWRRLGINNAGLDFAFHTIGLAATVSLVREPGSGGLGWSPLAHEDLDR